MPELIFIEGVSGVGKSTTVCKLSQELISKGFNVQNYVEFDYTNPIDFYCTAYLTLDEYERFCSDFSLVADIIKSNTILADDVRLVRYYNEDTPLFGEPLLSELGKREFCYNPSNLISFEKYTVAYATVWRNFALSLDKSLDYIIFDASLIRHPVSDMTRNYGAGGEQALQHIKILLNSLGNVKRHIFYLKTDNIGEQLRKAHIDRKQDLPTDEDIHFWESVGETDRIILNNLNEDIHIYNVTDGNYENVRKDILNSI